MIDWSKLQTAEDKADLAFSTALSSAITRNNEGYEAAIASMTAGYPPSEISTWEVQRQEAAAWTADNQAPTPWVDAAAAARQLDRVDYLQRTMAKASAFAQASAYLTGLRQRYEGMIKATEVPAELDAMEFDYSFPGV